MSISLFTPSRTVLLISDDYLFVYATASSGTRLVAEVPWSAENFEVDVARIIKQKCGGKPVVILVDTVEQYYRKERVLKKGVGVLDRPSLIQRKLNFAFPNYPIRASLQLAQQELQQDKAMKTDDESSKDPRKLSDVFLFSAIPETDNYNATLAVITKALVQVVGIYLLPIESVSMVRALNDRIEAKKEKKSSWVIFIGEHHDGSLRQIVIKDNDIALTRMSPLPCGQDNINGWAAAVSKEFSATISYVSRFGYQSEDGLNVINVSNIGTGKALEEKIAEKYEYQTLTPTQVAKLLSLKLGQQEDESLAAPIHVAWSARKNKFALPLRSAKLDAIAKPRKFAVAGYALLTLALCFLSYMFVMQAMEQNKLQDDIRLKQTRLSGLKASYQAEVAKKEALGVDIELVQGSIIAYENVSERDVDFISIFEKIGAALGSDMRIDTLRFEALDKEEKKPNNVFGVVNIGGDDDRDDAYRITMQIEYPATVDVVAGNKEVEALRDRLSVLLPNHKAKLAKRLKDYEYSEEITINSGGNVASSNKQDFTVEIVLEGPAS